MTAMKERMNKKPINYAKNTIDFLNGLTEEKLKTTNIKYRISIITWDRKVVNKHHHLDTFEAKIGIMAHQVNIFLDIFDLLFKKGLHFFWEEKGNMLTKKKVPGQIDLM